jgi:hypothetical protein
MLVYPLMSTSNWASQGLQSRNETDTFEHQIYSMSSTFCSTWGVVYVLIAISNLSCRSHLLVQQAAIELVQVLERGAGNQGSHDALSIA